MHIRSIAFVLVLTSLLAWQVWARGNAVADQHWSPRSVVPRGKLDRDEKSTIKLFRRAAPSVVNITLLTVQRDFFSLNLYEIPEGTGSGFVSFVSFIWFNLLLRKARRRGNHKAFQRSSVLAF